MTSANEAPDLAQLAAQQLAACLHAVSAGSQLQINSSYGLCTAELCLTLERLIPEILRRNHPEWNRESIDGFFFSSGAKTDKRSAELAGTCILISDQTVTPFA